MITAHARRFTLALLLGVSSLAAAGVATAQTTTPPTKVVTMNGVTGTDPVPPGCGCKGITQGTSTSAAPATTSTLGAAVTAFFAMLGLA